MRHGVVAFDGFAAFALDAGVHEEVLGRRGSLIEDVEIEAFAFWVSSTFQVWSMPWSSPRSPTGPPFRVEGGAFEDDGLVALGVHDIQNARFSESVS